MEKINTVKSKVPAAKIKSLGLHAQDWNVGTRVSIEYSAVSYEFT